MKRTFRPGDRHRSKGMEAVAVTGLTRHALRILAREGHSIATVVERLNSLPEDGSAVPFVTLIHGEVVLTPGQADLSMGVRWSPPPLLLRSTGGTLTAAEAQPLLGVMDGATFVAIPAFLLATCCSALPTG